MCYRRKDKGDRIRLGKDHRFGSDLYGRSLLPQTIGQNRQTEFAYRPESREPERIDVEQNSPVIQSQLKQLRQRLRDLLLEARDKYGLTQVEIQTLVRRLEGFTFEEIGEAEGVSKQAVLSRFTGRHVPNGRRWGGAFQKHPELIRYCERAARFRKNTGLVVHINLDSEDV